MKKKKQFLLWVSALPLCLSCSSGDDPLPAAAPQPTVIPYEVTVNDGNLTRATLNSSTQMIFETGDQLSVTGTDISGTLALASASNGERSATFSGNLTWSGSGTPADDLELSATLIGNGTANTQTGIAATFAEAFRKYSLLLTETPGTYASRSFSLKQQSTFVVFTITFTDGTAAGTEFTVTISDDNNTSIATGTTTAANVDNAIKATFTLALPGGTTLINGKATLTAGSASHEFSFGGDSKEFVKNKYYTATRSVTPTGIVMESGNITEWTPGTGVSGDLKI